MKMMNRRISLTLAATVASVLLAPTGAHAFCGFYVSGADAQMFNNATQVVLMREGTRTVLSMQNNYQGPPADFAMVVPVPVVLQKDNVKTLEDAIFDRVDQLAAPRLVEYWEQDPCSPQPEYEAMAAPMGMARGAKYDSASAGDGLGVTIEAQFTVGEYQIVILSAKDSTGLDTWLRQEKYKIPEGAEPLLRPYVQAGMKFFVAKVDVAKVKFVDGMATLSPLRFFYDADTFSLPVRLGLINSSGTQDLIVHILAPGMRYEVANYKNVTIPTNLDVKDEVRKRFGEFYAALFDATLEKNPGAVVTEYSWDAGSCDPCPTPALNPSELATLGQDVLYAPMPQGSAKPGDSGAKEARESRRMPGPSYRSFVLTRLHVRYGSNDLKDDLVFKQAEPIGGGRELLRSTGELERGAQPSPMNNFQGRYAIRHEWTGPIECESPRRGIWGGPPAGVSGSSDPKPAVDLAFAPRGKVKLASLVAGDVPELAVAAESAEQATPASERASTGPDGETKDTGSKPGSEKKKNKGCDASGGGTGPALPGLLVGLFLTLGLSWRRRSARPNS